MQNAAPQDRTHATRPARRCVVVDKAPLGLRGLCTVLSFLPLVGCLSVDLNGRPCATQDDCVEGYVCTGRLCLADDEPVTPDAITASPLCHVVYPADLQPDGELTDHVLLGAVLPTSYAPTNAGDRERALALAVDEINQTGGVRGKEVALAVCDSTNEREQAVDAVDFLGRFAQVPAIVGCATSENTLAAFTRSARATETLMLSPSATSTRLTDFPDNNLLWRVAPSDAFQGQAMAEWIGYRQHTRVAVLFRDDAYGDGLEEVLAGALCDRGLDACATQNYFVRSFPEENAGPAIRDAINAIATFKPQVLMIFGFSDDAKTALLAVGASDALDGAEIFLSDAAKQSALADALGDDDLCPRVFGSGPVPLNPNDIDSPYGRFARNYSARFSATPSAFTAHNYDALYTVALAYEAAQLDAPTGVDIAEGLMRLTSGPLLEVGEPDFPSARLRVADGESVNLTGASGPLDFDTHGDVLGDIGLWRLSVDGSECAISDVGVMYEADTGTFVPPPDTL